MKAKNLFFAVIGVFALTACSDDSLMETVENASTEAEGAIGFNIKTSNMTRGDGTTNTGLQDSHYEFGVYAYGNNDASKVIMKNYLVAYGENDLYKSLKNSAKTYGSTADGNVATNGITDSRNGYSSWFYEGLGKGQDNPQVAQVATDYTIADQVAQVLKYWDKSYATTVFYAYAPYASETKATNEGDTSSDYNNATKVAISNDTFTFTDLSSFYTTPLMKSGETSYAKDKTYQIGTADMESAITKSDATDYNKEIINYNEALYATKTASKSSDYGNDVKLEFKHINAKVKLAFATSIPGYKVTITDMVPSGDAIVVGKNNAAHTVTAQSGIVLTPAIQTEASTPLTETQPTVTARYMDYATYVVDASTGVISLSAPKDTLLNLYFGIPSESFTSTAKESPTVLYVVPNYKSDSYISDVSEINKKTGYTLHVSYKIEPIYYDGSAAVQVYDARVWIPADKCRWEAGKQYTYTFTITSASTGTTDIDEADPANNNYPYVDPTDPRVPTDLALNPIVFDGVTVQNYDNADATATELTISSYEFHVGENTHNYITASPVTSGILSSASINPVNPTTVLKGAEFDDTANGNWTYDSTGGYFKFTASYTSETDKTNVGHTVVLSATVDDDEAYAYIWSATSGKAYKVVAKKTDDTWGYPQFEDNNDETTDGVQLTEYTVETAYAIW